MAESSSDNPDLARALQAVTQNVVSTTFQVGDKLRWVWHQTASLFRKFWRFLSKRKRFLDPEDTENDSGDNMFQNYCSFGRIYSRQSSPFNTVDSVVNFGIKHEAADDGSDIEPTTQ
jgi:hypothetical protein